MIAHVIRTCFPLAAQAVADKAQEINKLNVFPVPDGDTGTNMSLTLQTVVQEVEALPQDATMDDVAAAITHGSLMGARGNSGVITSQILRGIAEGIAATKHDNPTTQDISAALKNGVKVAFKAVRKPVEGTILTVLKDISLTAEQQDKAKASVEDTLEAIIASSYESVARTPELLPVLKENGVVDSGAFGFATFVEAFIRAALGQEATTQDFDTSARVSADEDAAAAAVNATAAKSHVHNVVDIEINDDWEGSQYRYCTEFLFHAEQKDFDEEANLKYLSNMGDCELLVGAYPDYKIHVHTNRPDYVLRHMLHRGQIFNVFVHNMDLEAHERTEAIRSDKQSASAAGAASATSATGGSAPSSTSQPAHLASNTSVTPAAPVKELGVVAVAAGEGQKEILTSLGVDVVVSGGQTMNPSTADILGAIQQTGAKHVIVLPNNSNIRMAAEAAATACTTAEVGVVPTKSVLQAFAALFVMDPQESLATNVEEMTNALAEVRDGEVTTAVRDSQAADGSPIHAGDVMGIEGGAIQVVGHDVQEVTLELINRMQGEQEADTLTILAGQDMSEENFQELLSAIEEAQEDLEIDAHRGEQPLYPVIFSLE